MNPLQHHIERAVFYAPFRRQNIYVGITFALGTLLFILRGLIFEEFFFPFIFWNIFLAFIPWALSKTITGSENQLWRWAKGIIWLMFLPNAFYLATDLIHLRESSPKTFWIDLVYLLAFTSNAFLMGFYSFNNIEKVFNRHSQGTVRILFRIVNSNSKDGCIH